MSRPTIADLSPKYQAQAAAQILPRATVEAARQETHKPTVKQRRGMPSKLEMRFAADHAADGYKHQAITLLLANGVRYTPDFFCPRTLACIEIKGARRWDGSIEKLKFAAHEWPEFVFWLVTEATGGAWKWEKVMP